MFRKVSWVLCAVMGIALLIAGCENKQKDQAQVSINNAQTALTAAQGEAAKYVPDQLQAAQTALQSAKDALAKGDYQTALTAAQDAESKAKALAGAAAAKKDEWTKQWTDLSTSVPKSLEEVKKKLDAYSHGAHMPAGMDKAKLADANTQYNQLKQTWADASAAQTQGNFADAMKKASDVQDGLAKLRETLGIKS